MTKFQVGDTVRDNGKGYPVNEGAEGVVRALPGDVFAKTDTTIRRVFYGVEFPTGEWHYTEGELELVRSARPAHAGNYDLEYDVDTALQHAYLDGRGVVLSLNRHAEGYEPNGWIQGTSYPVPAPETMLDSVPNRHTMLNLGLHPDGIQ